MWIQLCELLVIVILLAMLASRSKSGSSKGTTFVGDSYREGTHSQLQATRSRVQDLERTIASLRSQARQRNRIIYYLWRRNVTEVVLRIAWNAYTGFWRALVRIPWPSAEVRSAMLFVALAGGVMWGVVGMIPQHEGPSPPRHFTHHRVREPTMISFQVTWGGETVVDQAQLWQCAPSDTTLRLVAMERDAFLSCQVLPDLECPALYAVPPFFLKEDDWMEWILLAPYHTEPAAITIVLD